MSKPVIIKTPHDRQHATVKTPWQAVPLVTAELRAKGYTGGEGGQWPLYITASDDESGLAFMGTDVGGMYRTLDGGENWAMCTVGINSSAAAGICIDPRNSSRVLCVGVNSTCWDVNGLYLSTDKGESWKPVYTYRLTGDALCKVCGHRDFRHQIAFDPTSYDAERGYCSVVYWCKETNKYGKGESNDPCLYKSVDGGESFIAVNRSEYLCNKEICTSFATGYVYLSGDDGVYRSTDGGESFSRVLDIECHGMDTVSARPDSVFCSTQGGMYVSDDNGETFSRVDESGYPLEYPARVRVSPVNPDRMVLINDLLTGFGKWKTVTYYSHDGGKQWNASARDSTDSFVPYNSRQSVFAWLGNDENKCISTGGDMILRSVDGGKTFAWGGNGYNGACITSITCNLNDPRLMAVGNQDYNGAFSTDNGLTWKYLDWTGFNWGGYSYGAYCLDDSTVAAAKKMGDNRLYIAYTLDGGESFVDTGITPATPRTIGVYGNNDIVFVGDYRSCDHCRTWVRMDGCTAVYAPTIGGVLYGADGARKVVRSLDCGMSWTVLADTPDDISWIAYDEQGARLFIVCCNSVVYTLSPNGGELETFADFSDYTDNVGGEMRLRQIAIDPNNGDLIYLTNARGAYASCVSMLRSLDAGKSWEIINRDVNDGSVGIDGAREASAIVLNNATRELFVAGGCRGMYKMQLPD